jgi:hypothetical protein
LGFDNFLKSSKGKYLFISKGKGKQNKEKKTSVVDLENSQSNHDKIPWENLEIEISKDGKVDINEKENYYGITTLIWASENEHIKIV